MVATEATLVSAAAFFCLIFRLTCCMKRFTLELSSWSGFFTNGILLGEATAAALATVVPPFFRTWRAAGDRDLEVAAVTTRPPVLKEFRLFRLD